MPNGPPVCCTHTIAVNHSMILVCLFIGSLKKSSATSKLFKEEWWHYKLHAVTNYHMNKNRS